jgi:hypothetical protein
MALKGFHKESPGVFPGPQRFQIQVEGFLGFIFNFMIYLYLYFYQVRVLNEKDKTIS